MQNPVAQPGVKHVSAPSPPQTATVRPTTEADLPTLVRLHDRVFGPGALTRTAYRVREQAARPISPYCRVSHLDGRLVAAIRLTEVEVGGAPGALLLGPLMIEPSVAGQGYGKALVAASLIEARQGGERLMLLVGNMSYYGRFGFAVVPQGQITLPGPVDLARLLAVELEPGALATYRGQISGSPTGGSVGRPGAPRR